VTRQAGGLGKPGVVGTPRTGGGVKRSRDRRAWAIGTTLAMIALLGTLIHFVPDKVALQGWLNPEPDPALSPQRPGDTSLRGSPHMPSAREGSGVVGSRPSVSARAREIDTRFNQGVAMLHINQYEHALVALGRVLELAPEMPEAHVNMGFALLGLERSNEAWSFFNAATELRPGQANAYYGMAIALEAQGELQPAIESMEAYLHLEKSPDSDYGRRARAALWEWEARLGRGAWGETRGVPPGFTAEQIRRDEQAVTQDILVVPAGAAGGSAVAPSGEAQEPSAE